ncbi:MAG: hypothetical protein HZC41_25070 [Chloroflexi bacterium]|nr:hypothetical protein [Chloroflexota bacterium]
MSRVVVAVIFLMALALPAGAQETATPTPTSTPTQPPTAQPLMVLWTLAPQQTDQPGQDVVLHYTISIDETVATLLLFAILVALWIGFVIARLRGWL